jgi:hypothetical protein
MNESFSKRLMLTNLAATLCLTGLLWFVPLVH